MDIPCTPQQEQRFLFAIQSTEPHSKPWLCWCGILRPRDPEMDVDFGNVLENSDPKRSPAVL